RDKALGGKVRTFEISTSDSRTTDADFARLPDFNRTHLRIQEMDLNTGYGSSNRDSPYLLDVGRHDLVRRNDSRRFGLAEHVYEFSVVLELPLPGTRNVGRQRLARRQDQAELVGQQLVTRYRRQAL